jgi:hypothetical protein
MTEHMIVEGGIFVLDLSISSSDLECYQECACLPNIITEREMECEETIS